MSAAESDEQAEGDAEGKPSGGGLFPNTRKTLIQKLQEGDTAQGIAAGNQFADAYWSPIYVLFRCLGENDPDAKDLAQAFFMDRILTGTWLKSIDLSDGTHRFRNLLRTEVKSYRIDNFRKDMALKRRPEKGFVPPGPQNGDDAESGHMLPLEDRAAKAYYDVVKSTGHPSDSPDDQFDRAYALRIMDGAMQRLHDDYVARGKTELFGKIKQYLAWNSGEHSYEESSQEMGATVMKIKMDVRDLRSRFRAILRDEVRRKGNAQSTTEADEEIRWVFRMAQGLPPESKAAMGPEKGAV